MIDLIKASQKETSLNREKALRNRDSSTEEILPYENTALLELVSYINRSMEELYD